jgi:hypothetical protein
MLTRSGPYNEEALIKAARGYLHLYADGKVPYKEEGSEKVCYVLFFNVNSQWIFIEVMK